MNNYIVYAHINKLNNKIYIGLTSQNPEDRWKNGKGYHSMHFGAAIKKYGWDNFEHVIIQRGLTEKEACVLEKKLIKLFKAYNPEFGYNEALGGFGGGMYNKHHTEESKEKISEARKIMGFSEEHKKHLSESKKGVKHHFAKKVYQYSLDGKLVKEWDYMSLAAETLKINKANIAETCNGNRKSAGGFLWKYERE